MKQLTDYFFARLETIYGKGKFASQYPDDSALQAAKREWCMDIAKFDREHLDRKLDLAKALLGSNSAEWPNPGAVLNLSAHQGAAGAAAASFKPLPDLDLPEQTPEVKRIGRAALDALQESLDASDYKDKERDRKATWEARHKEEMRRANERFGANMMARGEDGIYRPTDIPVEFGPGLEALS